LILIFYLYIEIKIFERSDAWAVVFCLECQDVITLTFNIDIYVMMINRRQALKLILAGTLTPMIPDLWESPADAAQLKPFCTGKISIRNIHNDEYVSGRYLTKSGRFDPKMVKRLNHLFRCRYTGQEHAVSPHLFLLLDAVRTKLRAQDRSFHLISGYRSPKLNNMLADTSHCVARGSYHLKGMAADISIDGVRMRDIEKTATQLKIGGVGKYSDFVHLDVGPVRYW
jgi:uncharacterized protein YcbK (DUF882 family)